MGDVSGEKFAMALVALTLADAGDHPRSGATVLGAQALSVGLARAKRH
jgi:hypothetical protein